MTEGGLEGRKEGRADGRTDGRMDGRMDLTLKSNNPILTGGELLPGPSLTQARAAGQDFRSKI